MSDGLSCESCPFWARSEIPGWAGECRAEPPRRGPSGCGWPETRPEHWCALHPRRMALAALAVREVTDAERRVYEASQAEAEADFLSRMSVEAFEPSEEEPDLQLPEGWAISPVGEREIDYHHANGIITFRLGSDGVLRIWHEDGFTFEEVREVMDHAQAEARKRGWL